VTPGTVRRPDLRTVGRGLHLLETEVEAFDVRAAVLVGADRAVVWDSLAHPSQMAPVGDLVGELPVTVVYSHADWDHAWGTCGIAGVESVVAQRSAAVRFATDVPAELEARRRADPEAWSAVHLVPPTTTFADELTLDLGGVTVDLSALPGHTPDCIVGFVPEWGVLLAGDTVETPLPVVNDGSAVREWVERLERWRDDAAVTSVIPAHGRTGARELIEKTVAYLRSLLDRTAMDPGAVPAFYRKTHEANVRAVRGQGR
jgi:glyoxylase-like metal-dependent hydrolase (beta-lactamase superfamily II)